MKLDKMYKGYVIIRKNDTKHNNFDYLMPFCIKNKIIKIRTSLTH